MIRPFDQPAARAMPASSSCRGNLFDSAIMKTSVISDEFRERYLSDPGRSRSVRRPGGRVRRARGLPRPDRRSRARRSTSDTLLVMRGAGPDRLSRRGRGREHARRRTICCARACASCPASATGASRAPRAALDPQRLARKRRSAAGWPCSGPGDRRARSTCARARVDVLVSDAGTGARGARSSKRAGGYAYPEPRRPLGRRSSAR